MEHRRRSIIGFRIDSEVAEQLGIKSEFDEWELDESAVCEQLVISRFEEIFGCDVLHLNGPDDPWAKSHGFTGLYCDSSYVLFEQDVRSLPGWRRIRERLRRAGIPIEKAVRSTC